MDGWYPGGWRYIEHLIVQKFCGLAADLNSERFSLKAALTADDSTPKLERIPNYLFCGATWRIARNLALSGSLFVFKVNLLMQPHIRHPRRCIFTLVIFDRHFSAPHIWVLRLPA